MPVVVMYICAAMLFIGVLPLPYGYYTLLRISTFFVFSYLAYQAHQERRKLLPWVFGFVAIVFNPVLKIYLPKEVWGVVDVAAGILLVGAAKAIKNNS